MTDIFFSYSSADRERVRPIRDALVEQGFEVFWDQQVPAGKDWDTWIRQHLAKSKCAMVFWSATSVSSDNVRHEATVAKQQSKLVSVLLEPLTAQQFPMGLYAQQAANLSNWNGDCGNEEWCKLRRDYEDKLTPPWVRRQLDEMEAELVGERARREGAERRDKIMQARIAKEAEVQQDLKQERDKALDEVAALKARVEKLTQAGADAAAREAEAESRDRALQAQIVKEAEAYQDLKRERDKALDEAAALKATVEELTKARSDAEARRAKTQQDLKREHDKAAALKATVEELTKARSDAEARHAKTQQDLKREHDKAGALKATVEKLTKARSDAEERVKQPARGRKPPQRAEARIHVDARIVHGAPDGWFLPGNGKVEWFQDYDDGPEMVVVPAGSFMMGSPESEPKRTDKESPQHNVTIDGPFAIARHAVTRGQFAVFADSTGYKWEGARTWRNPGFAQDDSHPVVLVSWEDARAYAVWLSDQTGCSYWLPAEAEWEYCCRAGTTTPFWWGSSITPAQANYGGRATVPVSQFAPNGWGLYQVHGNVFEWCLDVWHDSYTRAPMDGSAWLKGNGSSRVVRGGSWKGDPRTLRAAHRKDAFAGWGVANRNYTYDEIGFRVGRALAT